eukprot:scaffold38865_cov144-Skeletonema_dohrnii-CCMP3373.AAC.1
MLALALWGWQAQIGPHQSSGLSRGCNIADMYDSALKLDILLRNLVSDINTGNGPLESVYAILTETRYGGQPKFDLPMHPRLLHRRFMIQCS